MNAYAPILRIPQETHGRAKADGRDAEEVYGTEADRRGVARTQKNAETCVSCRKWTRIDSMEVFETADGGECADDGLVSPADYSCEAFEARS